MIHAARIGAGRLLAMLALCPCGMSFAQGPSWAYAQYEQVWERPQADQESSGYSAQISLPLSQYLYASASGTVMDAHFTNPSIPVTEEFESGSVGLGLHSTAGKAHAFGLLSYGQKSRDSRNGTQEFHDREEGVGLTLGARWLITPYLSFEPEGGFSDAVLDAFVRVKIALRLVPHVWLVGGYSSGAFVSGDAWSAGIRLTWTDSTLPPVRRRGAKVLPSDPDLPPPGRKAPLSAGQTLKALRVLRLQVRPLAGAPEVALVPAGATMVLQQSTRNDFGTWWQVTAGEQEGWIREKELK